MSKVSILQLKQYLKDLSREKLISEIIELFRKFSKVNEFYQFKLVKNGDLDLHNKYKKIIKDEFFPNRGFGKMRLSIAKKAINDFKKICTNKYFIADLMIFYVEMGVKFTLEYGDIDESFYNSMENMYESAAQFVIKNKLKDNYLLRFKKIVSDVEDIGWGFPDTLGEIYCEYFREKVII
ncbi:MAG: DUF6155 family protein [Patescibacteria group bacterium]